MKILIHNMFINWFYKLSSISKHMGFHSEKVKDRACCCVNMSKHLSIQELPFMHCHLISNGYGLIFLLSMRVQSMHSAGTKIALLSPRLPVYVFVHIYHVH